MNDGGGGLTEWLPRMATTFELIESATEDLDRLQGTLEELRLAKSNNLSLQDYRQAVALDDYAGEENRIVFLGVQI